MPRSLTLEQIRIVEPCPADWAAMTGGDSSHRFCDGCQKHVHDLSARPRAEGEAMLAAMTGSLCVRYAAAADGTVVTHEPRPAHWRAWPLLSTVIAFALALVGCRRDDADTDGPGRTLGSPTFRTMGIVDIGSLHRRPRGQPSGA